jgi:peptide/nickel transport system substrate-binding protein
MEKTFATSVAQIAVLLLFCGLVFYNSCQVDHLQQLVVDSKSQVEELNTTVSRLRNELESGQLTVAASAGGGSAAGDSANYQSRFYTSEMWEALNAPGNYVAPRSDRVRGAEATDGGTMHRAFIADIPGLNPVTQNAADVTELYHYVTETLAERQRSDPDRWISKLAYRIEVNQDHTEYHVWLRDDVLWHPPAVDLNDAQYAWLAGDKYLVADDFVFFLELVQNTQVEASFLRNYYATCTGIEVINDHEFIIKWAEPQFQSISFSLGMGPIPRWLYGHAEDGTPFTEAELGQRFNEHWYNQRAIGVGPYRFVDWQPGGAIKLERFDRYYGEKPAVASLEFRIIGDATARLNSLKAADIDFIPMQPTQFKNEVLEGGTPGFENGELAYETFQGTAYRYLGWNADGPYFGDRRVRLAMTHAFDRELILRENMHGLGRLITGNFFVDGPDYNNELQPWPFDLDRAAELLTQAGWVDNDNDGIREKLVDGQLLNFEFGMVTYGYRAEFIAAMEHYRNDLRSIGVVMNVQPVEWAVMVERMEEKDFDAFTGGWVLGWESDPYQIWHSSQADEPGGSNRVGFRNAEADSIIEEARRTFEPAARSALFHRFHEIVHEEQPYTFWFSGMEIGAWRSYVKNVNFSPLRPFASSINWYLEAR